MDPLQLLPPPPPAIIHCPCAAVVSCLMTSMHRVSRVLSRLWCWLASACNYSRLRVSLPNPCNYLPRCNCYPRSNYTSPPPYTLPVGGRAFAGAPGLGHSGPTAPQWQAGGPTTARRPFVRRFGEENTVFIAYPLPPLCHISHISGGEHPPNVALWAMRSCGALPTLAWEGRDAKGQQQHL